MKKFSKTLIKGLAVIVGIIATLVLGSCSPESNIKPTIDRTEKPIVVTVTFYDDRNEINRIYREILGLPDSAQTPHQWGFAVWKERLDGLELLGPLTCNIHSTRPKMIDDEAIKTLGHELLHCLYGKYHPEE